MNNSIYTVNKGINKSIEFRGLRAQYIWYFAGLVMGLLIVFAILYIIGSGTMICRRSPAAPPPMAALRSSA